MRLVEWVSYSKTMPACALVICHAGHGTMARALACGCPVLAVPHVGDMAENAARADWAGVGVRLPWRLLDAGYVAARGAACAVARRRSRRGLASWPRGRRHHDGAARAADLVEALAGRQGSRRRADELDQLRRVALDDVHRLPRAAAQLDHRAAVGDLERAARSRREAPSPRALRRSARMRISGRRVVGALAVGRRVLGRPFQDRARAADDLAVVGDERRHPVVAGQALDIAPPRGLVRGEGTTAGRRGRRQRCTSGS